MLIGCGCNCPTYEPSGSGPSGSDRGSSGIGPSDESAGPSVAPAVCGACSALPAHWRVTIDGNWFDSYFFDQPPFGDGPFREGVQDCRSIWSKEYLLRPYGVASISRAGADYMSRMIGGGSPAINWEEKICTVWQSDDRATLWPKYKPNGTTYPVCPELLAVPRVELVASIGDIITNAPTPTSCESTSFSLFFWFAAIPGRLGNDFVQGGYVWHFLQRPKFVPHPTLPNVVDCLPVVCIRNYGADFWQEAGDFFRFGPPYFLKPSEQPQWDTIPVYPA